MGDRKKPSLLMILSVVVPVAAVLAIGTGIFLTLTQKPEKNPPPVSQAAPPPAYVPPVSVPPAPAVSSVPQPEPPPPPPESSSLPESSSSLPQQTSAPTFLEAPAVTVNGNTATVTFKTDVNATVNAILSTSGEGISIATFYDHFNRGGKLESAVSKTAVYKVDENGQTATFDLPDLTKSYYLLVNAVENENGIWQEKVTVIQLHVPSGGASSSSSSR